jgi:hypothetical protein
VAYFLREIPCRAKFEVGLQTCEYDAQTDARRNGQMLSVKLELVQWPQTHAPRVRAAVIIVIRSDRDIDKPQQADYLSVCCIQVHGHPISTVTITVNSTSILASGENGILRFSTIGSHLAPGYDAQAAREVILS